MIKVYIAKFCEATNVRGTSILVKCVETGKSKRIPYDYSADNATRSAVAVAFGAPYDGIEYVGKISKGSNMYACQVGQ